MIYINMVLFKMFCRKLLNEDELCSACFEIMTLDRLACAKHIFIAQN